MDSLQLFNPHQRCVYSDSPFARIHYFYTAAQGPEMGWRGVDHVVTQTKSKKIVAFESKITKIRVWTFQMSGKITDFRCMRPAGAK